MILKKALELFGHIGIIFSGAKDVALIDMAGQTQEKHPVFGLDTGPLYSETYRFIDQRRPDRH